MVHVMCGEGDFQLRQFNSKQSQIGAEVMNTKVHKITRKYPCREKVISEIYELIGDYNFTYPNAIYFYGHTGTGKTVLIRKLLKKSGNKHVLLNCIECYTCKILFETIMNKLLSYELKRKSNCSPHLPLDNIDGFLTELRKLNSNYSYIICLDNAERIRDMDLNILPVFLRLQELTGLNICTVLVSQLPFAKYFTKTGLCEVIKIHCPQYTKNQLAVILANDFKNVKEQIRINLSKKAFTGNSKELEEKNEILQSLEEGFYENYLNVFLNVFYRACRDLPELRTISRNYFEIYCNPVLNKSIDRNEVSKLWRHISKPLATALSTVYIRMDQATVETTEQSVESNQSLKQLMKSLELPFYAKFLLIASFLASYNPAKDDKRMFVKNHGKQKKKLLTVRNQAKVTEKISTSLGPKAFSVDRLLAIFYAILDEKVGLSCNLLAQISTLIHLRFLTFVSGENNLLEGSAKLQCTVSVEFIMHIGKVVGFNVAQYLSDYKS